MYDTFRKYFSKPVWIDSCSYFYLYLLYIYISANIRINIMYFWLLIKTMTLSQYPVQIKMKWDIITTLALSSSMKPQIYNTTISRTDIPFQPSSPYIRPTKNPRTNKTITKKKNFCAKALRNEISQFRNRRNYIIVSHGHAQVYRLSFFGCRKKGGVYGDVETTSSLSWYV